MLDVAEEKGMIHAGSVIIEPTSGTQVLVWHLLPQQEDTAQL